MKSAAAGILAVAAVGLVLLGGACLILRPSPEGPAAKPVSPAPASAPGGVPAVVAPDTPGPVAAPGAPAPRGATLSGRVLSADDERPLAGVLLEVAGAKGTATTDAAGAFRLEGIPAGPRALSVLPPDHVPLEVTLEMDEGEEVSRDFYVAAGALLEGRVFFDEKPVAGATVAFEEGAKRSVTGEDGRYALRGVPAGEHMLAVTAPGFLRQERWAAVEPGIARTVLDLWIATAWTVRGIVRSNGQPVAGARVAEDWEILAAEPYRGVLSAADGTFTLRGADTPGSRSICAWKEGVGFGTSESGSLSEENVREGVVVEIPPAVSLTVRVIAEGDAIVEGAAVEAVAEEFAGLHADSWREPGSSDRIRLVQGVTDSSGRVVLPLTPGTWRIGARKEGRSSYLQQTPVPRAEEGDLDLRLYPGANISGRVIDAEGRPVPGAWVSAWASWSAASTSVTADGEGRFTLSGVLRADHRVQADHAGFVTRTIEGVKPGATPVEIVLDRESRVRGTVLLADGVTPCRSFTVRLYLEAKEDGTPWEGRLLPFQEEAVSDAEGGFDLRGVEAGRIGVEAECGDLLSPRAHGVRTEPGKDPPALRLVLRRGAVLHGKVVGDEGRPAAGAAVTLHSVDAGPPGGDSECVALRETAAGPDGAYEFRLLPAGKYLVSAEAEDHFVAERTVGIEDGTDLPLDLPLPRGSPFSVVVVDGKDSPLPGAEIVFLDEDGEQRAASFLEEFLVQMGNFLISDMREGIRIAPGSYRVRIEADGFVPTEVRFTAREGEPAALRVVLKPE